MESHRAPIGRKPFRSSSLFTANLFAESFANGLSGEIAYDIWMTSAVFPNAQNKACLKPMLTRRIATLEVSKYFHNIYKYITEKKNQNLLCLNLISQSTKTEN